MVQSLKVFDSDKRLLRSDTGGFEKAAACPVYTFWFSSLRVRLEIHDSLRTLPISEVEGYHYPRKNHDLPGPRSDQSDDQACQSG
jgi:hypothetical protein